MQLVTSFGKLGKNDAAVAGGKGASLGEMTRAGVPVPPGFVIVAGAFEQFLEETDLLQEIDAILHTVDHKEMHTVEYASEKIQALILAAQMPADIASEIEKNFKGLNTEFVAVRSSATAEDSASAAWAGQLDSYLNTTEKELLKNVQRCWASLFTPRAIFYRFEKELHLTKISVAVVVQKMVESEVSGIAFSVHPVTEDRTQLIIEAGWGLGEAIVSGQVTPDSYVVEKEPRKILDININTQTRALYRAAGNGPTSHEASSGGPNEWQDILEPKASSQVLNEKQILELSEIILRIEEHYGFPCDIEWAFAAGKFYIVQSRPITTLSESTELSKEQNFFNPSRWHYWGQWKVPLLIDTPWSCFNESRICREWPLLATLKGDEVTYGGNFFTLQSDLDVLREPVCSALEGQGDFFKTLQEWCTHEERDMLTLEGGTDLEALFVQLVHFTGCSMLIQLASMAADAYIRQKCIDLGVPYEKMMELSQPQMLLQEYQAELLQATDEVLESVVEKYIWIHTYVWTGVALTHESAKEEREELRQKTKSTKTVEPIPPALEQVVACASQMAYWRTRIADVTNKVSFGYRGQLQAFAQERGISYQQACELSHKEIVAALHGAPLPADILERSADSGLEYIDDMLSVVSIKDAKHKLALIHPMEDTNVQVIKGTVASRGKARGIARIIISSDDFHKLKEGDILVAPETQPDYVPIMKKAAAFITNQGGVTSHAAIVAREMKKPCVIDTKVATQVLKDGDLVEVDADNGVVRILEKSKPNEKVLLQKSYTRDFSLFVASMWEEANCKRQGDWMENVMEGLWVRPGAEGTLEVWYSKNEYDKANTAIVKKIQSDTAWFNKVHVAFEEHWEPLAKYYAKNEPLTLEELKDFYQHGVLWWTPMMICLLGAELDDVPDDVKEMMIKLRENTQEYSDSDDEVLQRSLQALYPEMEDFFHVFKPQEIFTGVFPSREELQARKQGWFLSGDAFGLIADLLRFLNEKNWQLEGGTKFIKTLERDATLVAQGLFALAMTDGLEERFGFRIPYTPMELSYATKDNIELWENKKGLQWFLDRLLAENKKGPIFMQDVVAKYKPLYAKLEAYWRKGSITDKEELRDFVETTKQAMIQMAACFYSGIDERTPAAAKALAVTMRENDELYSKTDEFVRDCVAALGRKREFAHVVLPYELLEPLPPNEELEKRTKGALLFDGKDFVLGTMREYAKTNLQYEFEGLVQDSGNVTEVRGQVAQKGKVVGRVRLVKNRKQAEELVPGEIMLSPMTTPDFIAGMQKAAAFVTDEGGIVCHAAIVAREMQKPCIIGTKIATQVLKDGDLVEVDADNGMVRILERHGN